MLGLKLIRVSKRGPWWQSNTLRLVSKRLWSFIRKAKKVLLTHWGRVTYICVRKLTIIASDNGLSPGRRQAIIWTSAGILLIWTLGTNFSEILIEIHVFSFKKMHLKMSSAKWRPYCLGLNVLTHNSAEAVVCYKWVYMIRSQCCKCALGHPLVGLLCKTRKQGKKQL